MELANKLGARFTLIVGDNEIAAGRYALKNMATGEQEDRDTQNEIAAQLAAKRELITFDMETTVTTGFSRRPSPHPYLRAAARRGRRANAPS